MQKNQRKAFILIWAIFLSLIISVSFIQISTKINKNLINNNNIINNIKIDSESENGINNAISKKDFFEQTMINGDKIIFDKNNEIIIGLKKNDNHLSKINSISNITIDILNGGPITYKNNSLYGIVNTTKTFTVSIGDLNLLNIGGFTRVRITSNNTNNLLSQYINYKIVKKIGNKEFIKTKGKIKSF